MKKIVIGLLSLIMLLTACGNKQERSREHYREGIKQLDYGQFDEALSSFNRAIELYDQDPEYFYYRGNVYLNLKDFETAVENYDLALALDSTYANAWANKGTVIFYITGNKDEACQYWLKAHEYGKPNLYEKIKGCANFRGL